MKRHKSAVHGEDMGNMPSGVVANRDRDKDEYSDFLVTYNDVFEELQRDITRHGYTLVPHLGGEWAGYRAYRLSSFEHAGLEMPAAWRYNKVVQPGKAQNHWLESLKDVVERAVRDGERSKEFKDKASKWYSAVVERPGDTKSVAYMASMMGNKELGTTQTVSGEVSGAHKFVPAREHFATAIQKIDPKSLLTIFPEAEAQLFMLGLGKMLAGVSGTKWVEGSIDYRSRAIFHIMEPSGGVGKSWLLDHVLPETLKVLGYKTATIDPRMERFSTIHWCPSDYAILDDATDSILVKVMASTVMKSVATNSSIFAEAKGIQGVDIQCVTTPFIASNCNNIYALYEKMDAAQMSRHIPLQVYSSKELELMHGDGWRQQRLPEHWARVATAAGTDEQGLMMWLLRCSLDYFLKVVGFDAEEGFQNIEQYRLEEEFDHWRSKLRVATKLSHREELTEGIAQMLALAVAHSPYSAQLVGKVETLTLHSDWLCTLLECWWKDREAYPEELGGMQLTSMSTGIINQLRNQLQDFREMAITKPQPAVWEAITERLISRNLIQYGTRKSGESTTMAHYASLWCNTAKSLPLLVQKYQELGAASVPPHTMSVLIQFSTTLLQC